jgi:hypothetical protein
MFDRHIMLAPLFNGWEWPPRFDLLLRPFTDKPIAPLHEVGSRARMSDPSWPRCFQKVERRTAAGIRAAAAKQGIRRGCSCPAGLRHYWPLTWHLGLVT